MAKEILCPICGATYNLAEEQLGKKVKCKKCEHAFTAGGEPKRRRDEDEDDDDGGIQDAPRGRSKAKKGRGRDDEYADKPKKTKSLEEQAKPRGQEGPGFPVTSVVVTCVALGVIVLCCGGGGFVYWAGSRPAQPQQPQPPGPGRPNPQPGPGRLNPQPPRGPRGELPAGPPAVANVQDALDALNDNDPSRRRTGADWLARAPRDEARVEAVSRALDLFVRDDNMRGSALAALKVWGTKENVPALVEFLQAQRANDPHWIHIMGQVTDAMAALGRIGDERGVEGVLPFAGTFGSAHIGNAPELALKEMGPKAEKGLVKYCDDPNDGMRNLARRLLQQNGTKTEVILPQVVADLRDGDATHRRLAADYLEKLPVVEAKREEVSKALTFALEDPDGNVVAAGVKAAKTWGTKENVPSLVKQVTDGGPFNGNRGPAMEALVAIKDERAVWPIAGLLGDVFNGAAARTTIEKLGRVAEKVALEHLKDADGPSRGRAWTVLSLVGTKGSVPAMKAAAEKEADAGLRNAAASALRLADLRP